MSADGPGVYPIVKRGVKRGDGLKYLSFQLVELGGSLGDVTIDGGEEELAVDFYSGPVRVEVSSSAWQPDRRDAATAVDSRARRDAVCSGRREPQIDPTGRLGVKGGVNLDHFGGAKVDQLVKG